jgi:SAM-dependent methyltransferase
MQPAEHFSRQSSRYRDSRPGYPAALYDFLGAAVARAETALDCATGNGQAAIDLAGRFDEVVAFDLSAQQIAKATAHPRVSYFVADAARLPLADHRVDLVTVAQALHWLDLPAFYAEIRRVARPGAVLAAWTYGPIRVTPAVDKVVAHLYEDIVGPYWPAERRHVESGYRDLSFPFELLPAPPLALEADWSLERLTGYLASWSAVQRYKDAVGSDPVTAVRQQLAAAWGPAEGMRRVEWPLAIRAGRIA